MSDEKKLFSETEILQALAGLLLNALVIALLIGLFRYLYALTEKDFLPGFVQMARASGNVF